MTKTCDLAGRVSRLALDADKQGMGAFEVHCLVENAFRHVHERRLGQLDERLEREFGRPGGTQPNDHVQQEGGEIMSKPLKEFASGSVRATIWENEHEKGNQKFKTQTVRVERRYRDENGDWQGTNGFRKNDLPNVEVAVRKAFEFLTVRERDPSSEKNGKNSGA